MRVFLFQPFNIPSTSTHPNLVVGDYIFVSKLAYGYSRYSFPLNLAQFDGRIWGASPQRGDLAVFKLPSNTDIDYVKRVVGIPSDRIQMISGVLNINGVPVKLEPTMPQNSMTNLA
jgi:signal peptidase I